jgi:hypothetical protein
MWVDLGCRGSTCLGTKTGYAWAAQLHNLDIVYVDVGGLCPNV